MTGYALVSGSLLLPGGWLSDFLGRKRLFLTGVAGFAIGDRRRVWRFPALTAGPRPLLEPLRDSEIRTLRCLPTNLTLPEIARELQVD
jgi:MFS family permease